MSGVKTAVSPGVWGLTSVLLNGIENCSPFFRESVTSYAAAQNIVVIKTLPGLANGAAGTLDSMNVTDLVGTLAGDDTALLVMKTNAAAEALCEEIKKML